MRLSKLVLAIDNECACTLLYVLKLSSLRLGQWSPGAKCPLERNALP